MFNRMAAVRLLVASAALSFAVTACAQGDGPAWTPGEPTPTVDVAPSTDPGTSIDPGASTDPGTTAAPAP